MSIPQDDEAGDARQATKLMPLWVVGWFAPGLVEALPGPTKYPAGMRERVIWLSLGPVHGESTSSVNTECPAGLVSGWASMSTRCGTGCSRGRR